jgi:hypothetical protein
MPLKKIRPEIELNFECQICANFNETIKPKYTRKQRSNQTFSDQFDKSLESPSLSPSKKSQYKSQNHFWSEEKKNDKSIFDLTNLDITRSRANTNDLILTKNEIVKTTLFFSPGYPSERRLIEENLFAKHTQSEANQKIISFVLPKVFPLAFSNKFDKNFYKITSL